jgi:predicted membrane chloride channel (bestrophin family)
MEFKKENYLNLAEIEEIITTPFPNTIRIIIAQKLKLYCVIVDKKLYVLQE